MPQLRHAETSALLAESSDPLDLAIVAEAVGLDRVIFDDVGPAFNIDAAIAAARDRAAAQEEAAGTGGGEERVAELEGPVAEAVAQALEVPADPEPVYV